MRSPPYARTSTSGWYVRRDQGRECVSNGAGGERRTRTACVQRAGNETDRKRGDAAAFHRECQLAERAWPALGVARVRGRWPEPRRRVQVREEVHASAYAPSPVPSAAKSTASSM